ncbi:homocysteine-responsive endoplasmic reticulum-resident ubiquitin-like domain member 2 protein [Cephus cinctus]|uniref:Homocysteine-responsive endoplasmic reticulum-resident ubiquitin-like domain member 2 protein n=1 Tax=Cephus cinctus TaxID=211228 RepID=A0AAJ7BW44_CEPCN|nr:homocysteine-responsive endoplasmic reticulum-resident ubiquitin-like domain member 2 protein [Cephus cinctus]
MEGAPVRLIVKAPNQQIDDQIIKCDVTWTVGKLKERLSEVYPSKPKSSEQKLIYSGQLLNDSSYLKDILRQYDSSDDQPFTMHLVCAPHKASIEKTDIEPTQTCAGENMGTENEVEILGSRTERLEDINPENNSSSSQLPPVQLYSQQFYGQFNGQQMAWMQQAYTHYLTQYMQLMAAQGIQLQSSIPYVQSTNVNVSDTAHNNNVNNNNVEDVEPQPRALAVDPPEAGNVAGDEAVAGLHRDWLDFLYMLSRMIVLFSIVYFYSSPLRFLIVTFLGFAIYLYQGGFFRVQPIMLLENNNGRVDNNNQIPQNVRVNPQAAPVPQGAETPRTVHTEAGTNPNEENEGERPGALAFTWTFFSSFFTSLIPDQPNVI